MAKTKAGLNKGVLMKANIESDGGSTPTHIVLDGLPSFLQGNNVPILNLFGYSNRNLREQFINKFKRSEFWKNNSKNFTLASKASDEKLLETVYSCQNWRFISFWAVVSKSTRPIEKERQKKVPDLLVFLLHTYDTECFDTKLNESQLSGLDTDLIRRNTNAAFDNPLLPNSIKKETDLRYLMLWPKLVVDLENSESKNVEERHRIAGAVFALASAYNSPELLHTAIEHSGEQLRVEFAPLISKVQIGKIRDANLTKPWESLVEDMQSLVTRLADESSDNLLDEIEATLDALRKAAADRQRVEVGKQWIENFFSHLLQRCAEHTSLNWLADEIERKCLSCKQSDLSQDKLIHGLETVGDMFESELVKYFKTISDISEKKASLAKMEVSIALARQEERQPLRREENSCREELNALNNQLSDIESSLVAALDFDIRLLPQAQLPDPEASILIPAVPSSASPETELPTSVPNLETSQPPTSDSEPPASTLEPESLEIQNSELEFPIRTPEPETPLIKAEQPSENNHESFPSPSPIPPLIKCSTADLLSTLAVNPCGLCDEDWIALGHLQRDWLEQCQPLRAWILADEVERSLTLMKKHFKDIALLPSWACRLLLLVSDAKLPLSDEETECLYKIRTLDNDQKELVILWLTAALLENTTDKPLRIARIVSPQQFDLPEHSLALLCAQHILTLVFNGGSLHPPKDQTEFQCFYDQTIKNAQDIINPSRNNYQKSWVKSFWKKLIAADGPMGRILAEAKKDQFPLKTLSVDTIVKELPEWSDIQSSYRHNIYNRIEDFCDQIEKARSARKALQEAHKADKSTISKQAVQAIMESIQRQPCGGWWFDAIKSGMTKL